MGARSNGLGNASACLADEWSLFNNPAGLAGLTAASFAVAYNKVPSLPGGDRMAAAGAVQIWQGTLSAGVFRFGDRLYSEHVLTAGYGNRFGLASLGARCSLIQYSAEGFGTRSVTSLSVGGIAELTTKIQVGAHIININQPTISRDTGERLPTTLIAGIAFNGEDLLVAAEVEQELGYHATWKAGVEYRAFGKFFFRTGFNLFPEAAFIGTGFRSTRLILDYAMTHTSFAGISHQVSAAYPLSSK